jgi:LL-diaminopimelate aminotransferase
MVQRNKNFGLLQAGYLFPEINRRKNQLLEREPDADIISLGIGNTTEPLTPHICKSLQDAAAALGTKKGYSGYGAEQGMNELRSLLAEVEYRGIVAPEEVFISDGAKCDAGRLQMMFGTGVKAAIQDPSYPVYVDSAVIMGQTGEFDSGSSQFTGIQYMPCSPDNNFFPDLELAKGADLIFICSPNNPTGVTATRDQLEHLVQFASSQGSIIIFDAAYSSFISDPDLPRSIFEIEGAREVAIEVGSFSKSIGFTGVRLGWTVVPNELKFDDGAAVRDDWNRVMTTVFNGASNLVQAGGIAALSEAGRSEMQDLVKYYMKNAAFIRESLQSFGVEVYGGENSPYIWARLQGQDSWSAFEQLLHGAHVVTTPGAGFGPSGEGFLRFSAFGNQEAVRTAISRVKEIFTSGN